MPRQYYQEMDVGPDLGDRTMSPIGPKEYLVEHYIRSLGIGPDMRKVLDTKPVDEQLQILGMLNKSMQQSGVAEGSLGMLSDIMKGTGNMLNTIQDFKFPSF
jgi:hypothetical protein